LSPFPVIPVSFSLYFYITYLQTGIQDGIAASWDAARGRATEVIDGLWVLVRKRGADGSVERYKALRRSLG